MKKIALSMLVAVSIVSSAAFGADASHDPHGLHGTYYSADDPGSRLLKKLTPQANTVVTPERPPVDDLDPFFGFDPGDDLGIGVPQVQRSRSATSVDSTYRDRAPSAWSETDPSAPSPTNFADPGGASMRIINIDGQDYFDTGYTDPKTGYKVYSECNLTQAYYAPFYTAPKPWPSTSDSESDSAQYSDLDSDLDNDAPLYTGRFKSHDSHDSVVHRYKRLVRRYNSKGIEHKKSLDAFIQDNYKVLWDSAQEGEIDRSELIQLSPYGL